MRSSRRRPLLENLEMRLLMANVQTGPIYPAAIWTPAAVGNYSTATSNPLWIAIHTTEEDAADTITEFQTYNSANPVSVNYMVDLEGNVYQFVSDNDIAYDVGNLAYNTDSIGIENERYGTHNATAAEYAADAKLVVWIAHQYNLPLAHFAAAYSYTSVDRIAPADPAGPRVDKLGVTENAAIIGHYQVPNPSNPNLGGGANGHTDPVNWNWTSNNGSYTGSYMELIEADNYPNTPSNSTPANNSNMTTVTPTLTGSTFTDLDPSATPYAAEWIVTNSSTGTVVYDSGTDTTDLSHIAVPAGKLVSGQTYTWQVRYQGTFPPVTSPVYTSAWSPYSTATTFTISNGIPVTPINSSPVNDATISTFTPTLIANAFSDSRPGATQLASEWLVQNSSNTIIYDSGIDTTDLSSVTVPGGILSGGQSYTWQVRYEDNFGQFSAYSTATSFTIPPASLLTLSGSALYLRDSADGQSLNIWNNSTPAGNPNQTIALAEITKIIINGASTGSSVTLDFANGSMSPQDRLTILGAGVSANNVLNVLGSNGNDAVSYFDGQFTINGTLVAYSGEGTFDFTPGAGTDAFSLNGGTFHLGPTASGAVRLSSLSVAPGATLDIGSNIVDLSYTAGNDPESTIQSLIASGFNHGLWTGIGITSSAIASNSMTSAVGYYDTGSQIVFGATWKGDANLDRVLNADDLSLMLLGQTQQKTDWSAGNFNYDTQINADDWIIFNYAVAYSNGWNYRNVFAPGVSLGSAVQMSQLLNTSTL